MAKHTTYRGIPIGQYRKMRDSMDAEAFAKWVKTVTGKPRGRGRNPATVKVEVERAKRDTKHVDWEALAKKLQRALAKQIKENEDLEWAIKIYKDTIDEQEVVIANLEDRSWLSRLFNLKG